MISKQKFWEQIECAIDTFCIFPYGLWTWKHFLLIMALKVIKKVNPASKSKQTLSQNILIIWIKVEKIYEDSLDLIPSPLTSVKIQIIGGKVYLWE